MVAPYRDIRLTIRSQSPTIHVRKPGELARGKVSAHERGEKEKIATSQSRDFVLYIRKLLADRA